MAFSLVQGGRAMDLEPAGYGEVEPTEGGPDDSADADADGDPAEFEDAVLLNQRLKAMIAEAEAGVATQAANRQGGSGGRNQRPRVPRLPGPSSGYSVPPAPVAQAEHSQGINRRKLEEKVLRDNQGIAARLAASKSCILPPLGSGRNGQQESSNQINRRRMAEKVQRENAGLLSRIEQPGRARSWGPSTVARKAGESELPKGWTRGIGGRAMPPPKMRWGTSPKYDAGEMAF